MISPLTASNGGHNLNNAQNGSSNRRATPSGDLQNLKLQSCTNLATAAEESPRYASVSIWSGLIWRNPAISYVYPIFEMEVYFQVSADILCRGWRGEGVDAALTTRIETYEHTRLFFVNIGLINRGRNGITRGEVKMLFCFHVSTHMLGSFAIFLQPAKWFDSSLSLSILSHPSSPCHSCSLRWMISWQIFPQLPNHDDVFHAAAG